MQYEVYLNDDTPKDFLYQGYCFVEEGFMDDTCSWETVTEDNSSKLRDKRWEIRGILQDGVEAPIISRKVPSRIVPLFEFLCKSHAAYVRSANDKKTESPLDILDT